MRYAYFGRLKDQKHKGIICFGYEVYKERGEHKLRYSVAFCSPKDNFSKKIAHCIIQGRINKGKYITVRTNNPPLEMKGKEVLKAVVNDYNMGEMWIFSGRCPNWANDVFPTFCGKGVE